MYKPNFDILIININHASEVRIELEVELTDGE